MFGRLKSDHLQHHKFAMRYCKKKFQLLFANRAVMYFVVSVNEAQHLRRLFEIVEVKA